MGIKAVVAVTKAAAAIIIAAVAAVTKGIAGTGTVGVQADTRAASRDDMSEQGLQLIRGRVTGGPSAMLRVYPFGYFGDTGRVKSMSLTEVIDAMHQILYAVWVCKEKRFSHVFIPLIGAFLPLAISIWRMFLFFLLAWRLRVLRFSSRVSGAISLMLRIYPFCNFYQTITAKSMSITKPLNAKNSVFLPIRVCYDETLHFQHILFRSTLSTFISSTNSSLCFRTMASAFLSCCSFTYPFFSLLFASMSKPLLLLCLRGGFYSKSRTSSRGKVKASFTEGTELTEPPLFTSGQEFRNKNDFQYLEDEGIRAIFVECILKFRIAVITLKKHAKVAALAFSEVFSTAYVNKVSDCIANAIHAWRSGDILSVHANCLSLVPCLFRCQAGKATRFLQRVMTPLLDSLLIIHSF